MITSLTFKLKRPYVEAVAKQFFHLWRLQMASKEKDIERLPLEDEKMQWIMYLAMLQDLDKYFTDRLKSGAKHDISIKLSTAQAVCLYRAVMHLPLAAAEFYLNLVRQQLIEELYAFMIELPAVARQEPAGGFITEIYLVNSNDFEDYS